MLALRRSLGSNSPIVVNLWPSLIAHELRTPLTFLSGLSELLAARTDLPEQAKEMTAELHDRTEQMVELNERLLELTRLQ
ncbi:MAG: hypothetical protein FI702_09480, partial [SAR202 cluster bacterium]|nr:hypothetical protein [SAR202 cluster bacterium]